MIPAPHRGSRGTPTGSWDDFFEKNAGRLYRTAEFLSGRHHGFDGPSELNLILAKMNKDWDRVGEYPAAYARRALFNAANDHYRKIHIDEVPLHRRSPDGTVSMIEIPDQGPSPEEIVVNADLVMQALAVIRTLKPEHEEVLMMTYAGHTPKEIASVLEEKSGTVRQRLRRARIEFDEACACNIELHSSLRVRRRLWRTGIFS
ncbi:sigma-70 family RNA polymerase sigma factor [Streptomyces sp. NBC_00878]|uniref:sigma-70 family RNA polymerase sigma factor n=1 Tax=Streptomyces sp. NBC_00878 TaxID=2975854 RepID=UPI002252711C|nr:sigma-70 family RNA polymerase sigma factor [Streptomyces sp. NBC_00878]MCX4906392.1 sigma-70 family RNA polymerase sigma factor [Streptomyces sp. NBC_00878]